jgi:hypothetical protein
MLMHYCDQNNEEVLVEIDRNRYQKFLQTLEGRELAEAVDGSIIVLDDDPRRSALKNADVFFSYMDVACGTTLALELLEGWETRSSALSW